METKQFYTAPTCRLRFQFALESSFLVSGTALDSITEDTDTIEWDD